MTTKKYYYVVTDKNSDLYAPFWHKIGSLQESVRPQMVEEAKQSALISLRAEKYKLENEDPDDNYEVHEFKSEKKAIAFVEELNEKAGKE